MTPTTEACAREATATIPPSPTAAVAQAQGLRWLLDDLLDAEADLLALLASPSAIPSGQRQRLAQFCTRIAVALR